MRHYRTEIVIPADRFVGLQLPDYLPEGRAFVTIHVEQSEPAGSDSWFEDDPDQQDIEWWDEFDDPDCDDGAEEIRTPSRLR